MDVPQILWVIRIMDIQFGGEAAFLLSRSAFGMEHIPVRRTCDDEINWRESISCCEACIAIYDFRFQIDDLFPQSGAFLLDDLFRDLRILWIQLDAIGV